MQCRTAPSPAPARYMLAGFLGILMTFLAVSHVARPATAATVADAREFVQSISNTAIRELTSNGLSDSERVKRMRELLVEAFDIEAIGRSVLGPYYRQASEKEFEEFLKLYKEYVAHNYASLFKKYTGEKIEVVRAAVDGGRFRVESRILQPNGAPIALEMLVHEVGSGMKAIDLKVEGVSMPLTHRKQFASVISRRNQGVEGLNNALRNAIEGFESQLKAG